MIISCNLSRGKTSGIEIYPIGKDSYTEGSSNLPSRMIQKITISKMKTGLGGTDISEESHFSKREIWPYASEKDSFPKERTLKVLSKQK